MGKDNKDYKEIKGVKQVDVYNKDQLISSKLFMNEKDILGVLIKDDEKISIDEAHARIENFMKGKVK